MITIPTAPNVGEMLKNYIKTNRKYKSGIANWLGVGRSAVNKYVGKADMNISTLWRLSHVLQYNFFADVGAQLPPEFTAVTENPLQARLTELEKQKSDLELQLKTLKEAIELMGRK
jgi:hypothetical protein